MSLSRTSRIRRVAASSDQRARSSEGKRIQSVKLKEREAQWVKGVKKVLTRGGPALLCACLLRNNLPGGTAGDHRQVDGKERRPGTTTRKSKGGTHALV